MMEKRERREWVEKNKNKAKMSVTKIIKGMEEIEEKGKEEEEPQTSKEGLQTLIKSKQATTLFPMQAIQVEISFNWTQSETP